MTASVIQIKNLSKSFYNPRSRSETPALDNVNFEILQGEFFCLLGPSGCGKSTILNIVAGFEQPSHGEAIFRNQPISGPGPERGVVFQQPSLYPWMTVLDNVKFGLHMKSRRDRKEDRDLSRQYIKQVGLEGFESHRPYELSGGMQQRAAIARALIARPEVLLMDEPFGALDARTRAEMQDFLLSLWQDIRPTVLFITHDVDEAVLLGDRLAVMSGRPGRIIETVSVDIPRPRTYEKTVSDEFITIKRKILKLLH